ncbi:MAG: hypothetical protein RI572_04300 [Salegentibacter sp.]|uniref:hypothetical protein n=1 Tax=Salegentibacter sp. TaxID=1903072 RepID=UPI00286FD59C|nr:hypothetical protein [Salegentibacter sp.]MDR9456613.1 hypothetical protein [Salegentibacter sp.]
MNKDVVLKQTITNLSKLSDRRLKQVSDFVEFLLQKKEDRELLNDIQKNATESETFNFLKEDEELYNDDDLSEKF